MSQVNINKTEALLTTATPDPVPDTLVLRDNAGNISANVITGTVSGTTTNANLLTYLPPATAATANTVAVRDASGNLTANVFNGALNGNASTASQLATAQTIALTGAVAGSASFNGTAGITINTVPSTLSSQILHLDDAQFSTTATTGAPTTVKTFRFAQDSTHPVTTLDVYASAWQPPIIIPVANIVSSDIVFNPNTNLVYVTNYYGHTVSVINAINNTVINTIGVANAPKCFAVNTNTNYIYVTNYMSNTVSVISGGSNTVVSSIAVQSAPYGVAVNPNTNTIYVTNFNSGSISVIDGSNNTVTATITGLTSPTHITVNTNTNYIYSTNYNDPQSIYIISGGSNTIVNTITLTDYASLGNNNIAYNPNTNVLVCSTGQEHIMIYTPNGSQLDNPVENEVGGFYYNSIFLNTTNNELFIGELNQIIKCQISNNTIINKEIIPINMSSNTNSMTLNPNNNSLYIQYGTNQVDVLDLNAYLQLNANVDGTNTLTLTQSAVTQEQIFALKGLSVPSTDGIHTLNLQLSTSNVSYTAYTQLLEVYQND